VFIFVGRLVGDKGINELVAAFQKLAISTLSVKLLLVGSQEPDLDPLRSETVFQIKTNPNIIAVGHQNDVRLYFAIANVLVFPSYREGFPNVVLQAGAMGLPSIVTNINGCNEIIEAEKNGLIIPVKDEPAIFNAMTNMLTNPILLSGMKQNTRPMIVSRYEQEAIWNAILAEYETLEQHV
jgi:glycosyltransferase involved in cell wall biosynthesis